MTWPGANAAKDRSMPNPAINGIGLSIRCADPNWRDLARNIDAALEAGVTFVELPLHQLDIVAGARIIRHRLKEVTAIARGRGARYTLHGHLAINLMDEVYRLPLHRELLKANIEIAAELGAVHLVVHSGFARAGQAASIEDAYDCQREALQAAGEAAKAAGVIICVENIFEFAGKRVTALPGRLARELAAIGHPSVMATFDFSHGYLHSGMLGAEFMEEARALSPFAKHLHIHDSFGRPADFWTFSQTEALAFGIGDLHLPVGWGSVPFDRIAAECRFPEGVVANIELQDRYWSELGSCIAATKVFAEKIIAHGG
jgi:sugar phosphate isomerase/epimerase